MAFQGERPAIVWKLFDASAVPPIVVAKEGRLTVGLRVDEETGAIVDRVELRVHVPK